MMNRYREGLAGDNLQVGIVHILQSRTPDDAILSSHLIIIIIIRIRFIEVSI